MPLSQPIRRALALTLLVAVAGAVWLGVVGPIIDRWHGAAEQIEQSRELLARYRSINKGRDEAMAAVDYWRSEVQSNSGAFSGNDRSGVAAELQAVVSEAVKGHQGDLLSIQILDGETDGALQRVAVRVQFAAAIEDVMSVFYDLESAQPYLFIDNLQIRSGPGLRRASVVRTQRASEEADTLVVVCDVYGYTRSETS